MYATIAEFQEDLKETSGATLRVLRALTDASLAQTVSPGGRTLGRLAWHLVGSLVEMPEHSGLTIDASLAKAPVPTTAKEIVEGYERAVESCVQSVLGGWSDADLPQEIPIYGERWTRSRVLSILQLHEVHHRGQLTVLMRQAGLRVPGVMGPAREEWAEMGIPEQP